jgi:hypothetical protein
METLKSLNVKAAPAFIESVVSLALENHEQNDLDYLNPIAIDAAVRGEE